MEKAKRLDTVLNEFLKIAAIPRPSHHEEKICAYLLKWAEDHGLKAVRDELKNVIIEKPASPGRENSPLTILQAHMDMVCVSESGVQFDPVNDPIRVINDGRTLTAEGTSLGADDGIGVAACLYILQDDTLDHGPLRVILTADEEDGMDSIHLDPAFLEGSFLVNLDHEETGVLCNSCAGGDLYHFTAPAECEATEGGTCFTLKINNLLGGHSGINIHEGRANAIVTLASFPGTLALKKIPFRIVSFTGGQASNAIPKEACLSFVTDDEYVPLVKEEAEHFIAAFEKGFKRIEQDYHFELTSGPAEGKRVLTQELSERLIRLMCVIPNNIHTMSPFVGGLVESSANLGKVTLSSGGIEFLLFARSSSDYYAEQLRLICGSLAAQFSFELSSDRHTPAWSVNPESRLTDIACEEYKKLTGKEMSVQPIHAGLECGAFSLKNPALDMIAIGPTLENVHSPDEVCHIEDVGIITDLVVNILKALQ